MWKIEEKEERMTAPITLPPVDPATLAELHRRYEDTPNVESRTRYQMILLAQQDYKVTQIARIVLRSEDTVARVLKRFLAGGLDAVPRRMPPGRERRITAEWEAELLRVIELDPHEVGQDTANWTTEGLAEYLYQLAVCGRILKRRNQDRKERAMARITRAAPHLSVEEVKERMNNDPNPLYRKRWL